MAHVDTHLCFSSLPPEKLTVYPTTYFCNLWQSAIRLAGRTLANFAETTHDHTAVDALTETHACERELGGLSDQNKLYRFRRFYFSLNTMTTGTKPARISYYLLQHVHINPHVPKKKQLKRCRHRWKHSSRLNSVEHIIDERRDLE